MAVLREAMPTMLAWLHRFRRPIPDAAAAIDLGGGGGCAAAVAVAGVADIEESVWSPRYGLKGMIDASVMLRVQPLRPGAAAGGQVSDFLCEESPPRKAGCQPHHSLVCCPRERDLGEAHLSALL
jgi:hypothetical protein